MESRLAGRIPTQDTVKAAAEVAVRAQVQAAQQEMEATAASRQAAQVREFQERSAQAQANGAAVSNSVSVNGNGAVSNGGAVPPAAAVSNTGAGPFPSGGGGAEKIAVMIQTALVALTPVFEKGFNMYLQMQGIKMMQSNPIALATRIMRDDPITARFLGALMYADPMQQQVPGIIANTVDMTARAVAAGLVRSGTLVMPDSPGGALSHIASAPPSQPSQPGPPANAPAPSPSATANPPAGPSGAPSSASALPSAGSNAPSAAMGAGTVTVTVKGRTDLLKLRRSYQP
jgi:hypothetical protein